LGRNDCDDRGLRFMGSLSPLASELVQRNVDIIMADGGTPTINAVRDATRTIPTVFCCPADPVAQGIVTSLAKPGGNLTGVSTQNLEYGPKSLELLKEILPSAKRVAVLSNPTNSSIPLVLGLMQTSAQALGLEIDLIDARTTAEFERAFVEIARHRPAGLIILSDAFLSNNAPRLTALATRHRLPTMGGTDTIPESGGLASYGPNRLDLLRGSAVLVGKILKGAKPAALPVEQPTKFDLVINMRTAKALGLNIPASVLLRANNVIE
jgi:putative ABC transport system substrate-binding protein